MTDETKTPETKAPEAAVSTSRMYILQEGKFYKPNGEKLKVGEAIELTDAQAEAFGSYFKAEAIVQAEDKVAAEMAAAAAKAAETKK